MFKKYGYGAPKSKNSQPRFRYHSLDGKFVGTLSFTRGQDKIRISNPEYQNKLE